MHGYIEANSDQEFTGLRCSLFEALWFEYDHAKMFRRLL